MNLHEDKELFRDAVRAASEFKEIREIYIEKDYWVTYALRSIFTAPVGSDTIFKGGTALSKCFNIVKRFSEDIDLVVVRKEGDSNARMTNKIRAISQAVTEVLPEVEIEGITRKRGMNRKTAHTYSKEFTGEYGQVRDTIIVEASWLGSSEPNVDYRLSSYISEMMLARGQDNLAKTYGLIPFNVNVLDVRRTLCEKIMSLVRFSYTEEPMQDLANKIRHSYDLHLMLKNVEIREFFESPEFDALLEKVAYDDAKSYRINIEWLNLHPAEALVFSDIDTVWKSLQSTYEQDFAFLVFGELPGQEHIYETLLEIKNRLSGMEWNVKIEADK